VGNGPPTYLPESDPRRPLTVEPTPFKVEERPPSETPAPTLRLADGGGRGGDPGGRGLAYGVSRLRKGKRHERVQGVPTKEA
jgi:hypothetical protein